MKGYIENQLENGLRVALLPTRSNVVYCGFAIHSGSRHDPEHLPGLAHFVEHTIFKGTERRHAWHIINRMELVGGELNAYTTKETTFVYTAAPKKELRRSMELLNDLIRHASFPEVELEKEREVVKEEISLYRDTPSDLIFDHFEEKFFEDYELSHPILGNEESLDRMSREDCLEYVRKAFTPSRMLFFCMGQVTEQRFSELTTQLLGEPFEVAPTASPMASPRATQFNLLQESDTHQAHVLIGGVAPTLSDLDRTEATLLLNLLAGPGMNSRLVVQLREHRGWVYSVESSLTTIPDIGWWQIYFGCDPLNAERALEQVLKELKKLQDAPLTPTALRAWVKQIKGQATMSTEQSESQFLAFGRQLLLKGCYHPLEEFFHRLDGVTIESLMRVAQSLFAKDNISRLIYQGK